MPPHPKPVQGGYMPSHQAPSSSRNAQADARCVRQSSWGSCPPFNASRRSAPARLGDGAKYTRHHATRHSETPGVEACDRNRYLPVVNWGRGQANPETAGETAPSTFSCQRLLDTSPHHHRRHSQRDQLGVQVQPARPLHEDQPADRQQLAHHFGHASISVRASLACRSATAARSEYAAAHWPSTSPAASAR